MRNASGRTTVWSTSATRKPALRRCLARTATAAIHRGTRAARLRPLRCRRARRAGTCPTSLGRMGRTGLRALRPRLLGCSTAATLDRAFLALRAAALRLGLPWWLCGATFSAGPRLRLGSTPLLLTLLRSAAPLRLRFLLRVTLLLRRLRLPALLLRRLR